MAQRVTQAPWGRQVQRVKKVTPANAVLSENRVPRANRDFPVKPAHKGPRGTGAVPGRREIRAQLAQPARKGNGAKSDHRDRLV